MAEIYTSNAYLGDVSSVSQVMKAYDHVIDEGVTPDRHLGYNQWSWKYGDEIIEEFAGRVTS